MFCTKSAQIVYQIYNTTDYSTAETQRTFFNSPSWEWSE